MKIVSINSKGSRPAAGSLCVMETSLGFIAGGVGAADTILDISHLIHFYRALLNSPEDASFYPMVERNELLIPPVNVPKAAFKKGGFLSVVKDRNAPKAMRLDRYFMYESGFKWDSVERAFIPAEVPLPTDRPHVPIPVEERTALEYFPGGWRSVRRKLMGSPKANG